MNNQEIDVLKQTEVCGRQFQLYGTKEEPLFLAKDVAEMIEYAKMPSGSYNVSKMLQSIDEDEKLILKVFISGQHRDAYFLTEDGLYEVLMRSTKPVAKEFKKGIKKVLHELRTQGIVMVTKPEETPEEIMARAIIYADKKIKESQQRIQALVGENTKLVEDNSKLQLTTEQQQKQIQSLLPKADYYNKVLQSDATYTVIQLSKELGFSSAHALNLALEKMKIQFRRGEQWFLTAPYAGFYLTKTRTHIYQDNENGSKTRTSTVWTERGRLWLHQLTDKGHLVADISKTRAPKKFAPTID